MASSSSSDSHSENNQEMVWDEEYDCHRVDDVLYPEPIREYPPAAVAAPPPTATGRRNLPKSRSLGTQTCFFQLFRCEEINKYILTMNEVETVNKTYYVLTPSEDNGKRKMKAKETPLGQRVISPVVGEIYLDNLANRTDLPIEQRLEGSWKVEQRVRVSLKTERFYRHDRVHKTFRSMTEVATFIAYNMF